MLIGRLSKLTFGGVVFAATLSLCGVAMAGNVGPAPLAGALGPFGALAACAAVGGYFLIKKLRKPR